MLAKTRKVAVAVSQARAVTRRRAAEGGLDRGAEAADHDGLEGEGLQRAARRDFRRIGRGVGELSCAPRDRRRTTRP